MKLIDKVFNVAVFCTVVGVTLTLLALLVLPASGSDAPEALEKFMSDYGYPDAPIMAMGFHSRGWAASAYCRVKTEDGEVSLKIRRPTALHDWKVVEFQKQEEISDD